MLQPSGSMAHQPPNQDLVAVGSAAQPLGGLGTGTGPGNQPAN